VLDAGQARGRAGIVRATAVGVLAAALVLALAPIRVAGAVNPAPATASAPSQSGGRRSHGDRSLVEAAQEGNI
jgi:hypothetical protein